MKHHSRMTRKEILALDKIPIGELLDTEEKVVRAVMALIDYLANLPHPTDFDTAWNDWIGTQPWYTVDTQADAGAVYRTYWVYKLSEGRLFKRIKKIMRRL